MGKKKTAGLMASLGNGRLELLIGAFVGLLGAVMVMLMPVVALQDIVLRVGLPSILPPFDPPLGIKAQLALAGGVGVLGFAFTWSVMWLVDKAAILFEESDEEIDDVVEAPKVRRRDRHPDAPTRAPVSVSRDLGITAGAEDEDEEPAPRRFGLFKSKPVEEAAEPEARKPWRRNRETEEEVPNERLRRFRAQAEAEMPPADVLPVVEPEAVVEPVAEVEFTAFEPVVEDIVEAEVALGMPPVAEPEELELDTDWLDAPEPDFAPHFEDVTPAPFVAPEPEPAPFVPEPPVAQPAPEPVAAEPAPFVPNWMVQAEAAPAPAPAKPFEPAPAIEAVEAPQPAPRADRAETVDELVARLERAVAQRIPSARPAVAAPVPVPASAPAWAPEPQEEIGAQAMDTRLRSALANLKRFAPQG